MSMLISFSSYFQELYLSGNRLTTLPPVLCSLPRLQVLALRSNQLTTFPQALLTSASLTYLDLAFNRVEALPVEVLLRADPPALATLLLEGNPLQRPPIQCLQEEGESGSSNELVTGFAQIDARLRRYYQVESGREGGENAGDEGKMTEEKEIKSKRVQQQQQQTCDTSVTAIAAAAEDEGEDEDDDDVSYNVSRVFSFLLFSFMSSTNCSCLSLFLFLSPSLDRMKPTICLRDTPQRR